MEFIRIKVVSTVKHVKQLIFVGYKREIDREISERLSYGTSSRLMTKDLDVGQTDVLKTKRCSEADWQKSGEGFTGFNLTTLRHKNLLNKHARADLQIDQGDENQSGGKNVISWSSSEDEDLSLSDVDKKGNEVENSYLKQRSTLKRRRFKSYIKSSPEPEVDVDILVSDSESNPSHSSQQQLPLLIVKENILDVRQVTEPFGSVDIQDVESEDSRSTTNSQPECSETLSHVGIFSPDISGTSTLSSASFPSQQSQRSKVKASDWVKSLDLKTPTKDMQLCTPPVTEDSSKKKKKFQRGGLADQLSRLLIREKSSMRMWSHQQKSTQKLQEEASNTITVRVESFELLYSLQLAKCSVLTDSTTVDSSTRQLCSVLTDSTTVDSSTSQLCSVLTDSTTVVSSTSQLVMFSSNFLETMDIQIGCVIKISAPWQQLELKQTRETILLCTDFCQIEDIDNTVDEQQIKRPTSILLKWNCPCVSGLVEDSKNCPAYQFPCLPGINLSKDSKSNICSTCVNPTTDRGSCSTCVNPTTDRGSCSTCVNLTTDRGSFICSTCANPPTDRGSLHLIQSTQRTVPTYIISDSLLECIENHKRDENIGVCFRARIQRVHCKWNREKSQKCWTLLTEDGHGTVSEILLPSNAEERFSDVLHNGEGKTFTFTGLRVHNRTTRDRDKDLFSMIDRVWSGIQQPSASQDSKVSSKHHNKSSTDTPGFCYILIEDEGCTGGLCVSESKASVSKYHKIKTSKLADISSKDEDRICFFAKVLYISTKDFLTSIPENTNPEETQLIYVTDKSLLEVDSPYKILQVKSQCAVKDLDKHENNNYILYFKDVLQEGLSCLYCDGYTRLMKVKDLTSDGILYIRSQQEVKDAVKELTNLKINLPDFRNAVKTGYLCKVQGCIVDVDESKAYSWEVCDKCGSDKLVYKRGTKDFICQHCNSVALDPVTKMKMEVIVRSHNNHKLQICLLQSTIELLLPEHADEDGYELSCVLQKSIGPLNCVIQKIVRHKDNKIKDIFLQEVKLM